MADGSIATFLKVCTRCGDAKPVQEFKARPDVPHLLRRQCVECHRAAQRKAGARYRARKRYAEGLPAAKPRLVHPDGVRICSACGEAKPATTDFFHRVSATNRKKNPDGLTAACKRCLHHRMAADRKGDPSKRLRYRMAGAIGDSLRAAGSSKRGHRWENIVGYTLADLRRHLERQFTKGMSWDNYGRGGWHIDHVVPASSFAITGPECPDLRACFALTNLRPLWEPDNLRKNAKRIFLL